MPGFMERARMAINILTDKPFNDEYNQRINQHTTVVSTSSPMDNSGSFFVTTSEAILAPIKTRISIDVAAITIRHVLTDKDGRFLNYKSSELNDRLNLMANIDQTGRNLIQDAVSTMLDRSAAVFVPVETTENPVDYASYEILDLRVGYVTKWRPKTVVVNVYNDAIGKREEIELPKGFVAIAYNPLYEVMNRTNSTLRRLLEKIAISDSVDNDSHAPGIDLILQLPFSTRLESKEEAALRRIEAINTQLNSSRYGVAYIDALEKVIPLNRRVENTLRETVQVLTNQLYSELGISPGVFTGELTEEEQIMYHNRTIEPCISALIDSMRTAFFTRTALSQGHNLMPFQRLFKMAPLKTIGEFADTAARNAILSPNEIRAAIGFPASKDPESDELRNRNLNQETEVVEEDKTDGDESDKEV